MALPVGPFGVKDWKFMSLCDGDVHVRPRANVHIHTNTRRSAAVPFHILGPWIISVLCGLTALFFYEFKGETPTAVGAAWPDSSVLERDFKRPTLVFFVHPRCPCTAAGIAELDRVLSSNPEAFRTYVVLPVPADDAPSWHSGNNITAAKRLPDASIIPDPAGAIAGTFGIRTSGTALVYDTVGDLRFRGGLTASRGHEGENFGTLALRALAKGNTPERHESPVFGCEVVHPTRENRS